MRPVDLPSQAAMTDPTPFEHPERIGPYQIIQVIGEGGMGIVYDAEQKEPVRRRVALKMMKVGMDTKEVVARFEAERQALAVMQHPGIAKVLDAGATEQGRPYFVMELVRGIRLDEYCDRQRLSTRQRVELFVDICGAVQHAHQKGVIHRDLKPSNILVTEEEGRTTAKVIDFGVAKATGQRLTEETLATTFGQALGTLAYMSPEQAEMTGLDVDTRTDIYSLGVILQELLTGKVPLDPKEVGAPAFLAQLIQRDHTMPTLGSTVSRSGREKLAKLAELRRTDVNRLRKELRGDLQWIVQKAIDKDRTRRYETANGLAMDLQRYLADEPVVARPPSFAYRTGKLVRRNRTAVAAAVVVAVALVVSAVVSTVGMVRAVRAEAATAREAEALRQVSDFLVRLFEVSDPSEARGSSVTARELLDEAAGRIDAELAGQPLVKARLMQTMGEAYRSLGLYEQAQPMLEQALAVREEEVGQEDPGVAESLTHLGWLFNARGRYDDAEHLYRRALEMQQRLLPEGDPAIAETMAGLGSIYTEQGRFDEAEPLLVESLAMREQALDPDDPELVRGLGSLAHLYFEAGRHAEADSLFQRELDIRERTLGAYHPDVALTLANLGGVRWYRGMLDDADRFLRRALEIRMMVLSPDHPDLADALNSLGALAWTRGRFDEAAELYNDALRIYQRALGPEHVDVGRVLNNLAETQWKMGEYDEAEATFLRALRIKWKMGEYDEAEATFLRALRIKERVMEPGHPSLAVTLNGLANVYRDQGRWADAERRYRRALDIRSSQLGPEDPALRETLTDYARMLRNAGRPGEAEALEARLPG
jgi:serine/threonine protein kinase/tetratricopeptide (TPR) repeat protein